MSVFSMTKIVMKAMVRPPVTHRYPFEPRVHVPLTRGELAIEIEKCIFCMLCEKKCPTGRRPVRRKATGPHTGGRLADGRAGHRLGMRWQRRNLARG